MDQVSADLLQTLLQEISLLTNSIEEPIVDVQLYSLLVGNQKMIIESIADMEDQLTKVELHDIYKNIYK